MGVFLRVTGLMLLVLSVFSCMEKGCLDPRAINYAEEADRHNGECEYEGCFKEDFPCKNGGTCNDNGECDCPDGYYGDSCQNEKKPKGVQVESIRLTNNEFSEPNEFMDPELYIVIKGDGEDLETEYAKVPKGETVFFSRIYGKGSWNFDKVEETKQILVKDDFTDDTKAKFDTAFYKKGNGFPDEMIFKPKAYDLKFEFELSYEF